MSQIVLETITFNAEQGSAPATPAANKAVVYTKDDGAGRTQLAVKFANSSIETVASLSSASASTTNTVTNKIPIQLNGTTYYILASTSGV